MGERRYAQRCATLNNIGEIAQSARIVGVV